MWHRYAALSAGFLGSAIALSPAALAQNVDIQFSGTVPVQATFSNVVTGTAETIASTGSAGSTNTLESVAPATLNVQPSTPATITVSPPSLVSGPTPDPDGTTRIGFLKFGSTTVRSDVGGGTATLPAGNSALEVDMRVQRPSQFPPGTYTYAITVTITP